jgi:hypothetical protein
MKELKAPLRKTLKLTFWIHSRNLDRQRYAIKQFRLMKDSEEFNEKEESGNK